MERMIDWLEIMKQNFCIVFHCAALMKQNIAYFLSVQFNRPWKFLVELDKCHSSHWTCCQFSIWARITFKFKSIYSGPRIFEDHFKNFLDDWQKWHYHEFWTSTSSFFLLMQQYSTSHSICHFKSDYLTMNSW